MIAPLRYGLGKAVPARVKAAWGARWIWPDDQVWNRTDAVGEQHAKDELLRWLNETVDGQPAARIHRLIAAQELYSGDDKQVTLYEDDRGIVVANPQASYGYVYVAAWLKAHEPEGER